MEPNPYEASRTDQIPALAQRGDKRIFRAGLAMTAFAFVFPLLAFALARAFVEFTRGGDPVPQGSMAIAFLGFMMSFPLAAFIFVVGSGLAWFNRRS